MCQTEAIGRDLSLMKRLSEETGSLPLCRCRVSPILMSLQTPGTTYHPLAASIPLILLLHNLLLYFSSSSSLYRLHPHPHFHGLVFLSASFFVHVNLVCLSSILSKENKRPKKSSGAPSAGFYVPTSDIFLFLIPQST